eukprot:scaffold10573_cov20-Prasinocladus_malaysianus.AAC.1
MSRVAESAGQRTQSLVGRRCGKQIDKPGRRGRISWALSAGSRKLLAVNRSEISFRESLLKRQEDIHRCL